MLWTIAAPFFTSAEPRWIDDAVPGGAHRFRKIGTAAFDEGDWHRRGGRATPFGGWRRHWRQATAALATGDGLVTVFPQLAFAAALRRSLGRRRQPMIAWCFNLGAYPTGLRRRIAGSVLRRIDHFVVHSRAEVDLLRAWLDLDADRVSFVPLQRAPIPVLADEDRDAPFMLAMGSANRDYPTLLEAARISGLPLTIVAAPRLFDGVALPDNVTLLTNLSTEACWRLAQRARISIVALADSGAASGQITVVEALRMGRPLIATRTIGTVDYIEDDDNGLLVPPSDPAALAGAMRRLWDDPALRNRLGAAGAAFAETHLSDEKAAGALMAIVDRLEKQRR